MKASMTNVLYALTVSAVLLLPGRAAAHCDTLKGPVVAAARLALESGDVSPVLKWIKKENEPEVRAAFDRTLRVRLLGAEARELADTDFFETLVRIHRGGEGEPYTGLKPAEEVEPGIAAADRALDSGSAEEMSRDLTSEITAVLRQQFARVQEARKHADENVTAGREYVAAYVEFIHHVERLHEAARLSDHHKPQVAQADTHAK